MREKETIKCKLYKRHGGILLKVNCVLKLCRDKN